LTKTMTIEDAQANLDELIDEVKRTGAAVTIADERGRQVVMIPASEWASLKEATHLTRSPKDARRLFQALARALRSKGR